MRFDSKLSLDKGPPSLPPTHFQQQAAAATAATTSPSIMYPEHLCLAMDCEMVGVGPHHISVLARVSIVNFAGEIVYDSFVKVEEKVTDYRTAVSGIRPDDLRNGVPYGKCRSQVRVILAGKLLIGHGLQNDLAVLNLRHPAHLIRDTSLYLPYSMQDFGSGIVIRSRSLRDLMREFCGQTIQSGEHDSVEDARAAMTLYGLAKTEWDATANLTFTTTTTATNSYNSHANAGSSHPHRPTSGRKSFARPSAAASSSSPYHHHHHHHEQYNGYYQSYHRPATTFY
jgi:DNA polymerase III epsilon subunit-like protein